MPEETPRTGSFCTAILHTPDAAQASRFYGDLLGWTAVPAAPGFWLFTLGGRRVAAMEQVTSKDPVWVPCVSVEDTDAVRRTAETLGARHLTQAEIHGVSRTTTLSDPEGALFGLWQPMPLAGAEVFETPGSLWWLEVLANDVERSRGFYGSLFGWGSRDTAFDPFRRYVVFERDRRQEGGILPIDPEWGVSPRWNTIIAVEDADETIARTEALGGGTVHAHIVPVAGRIAVLADPQGAVFVVRGPVPAQP